MNDPHWGFILAAYVVAGLVIGAMIVSIWTDHRRLRKSLTRFGARGLDRE